MKSGGFRGQRHNGCQSRSGSGPGVLEGFHRADPHCKAFHIFIVNSANVNTINPLNRFALAPVKPESNITMLLLQSKFLSVEPGQQPGGCMQSTRDREHIVTNYIMGGLRTKARPPVTSINTAKITTSGQPNMPIVEPGCILLIHCNVALCE